MKIEEIMDEGFLALCLPHNRHPTNIGHPPCALSHSLFLFNKSHTFYLHLDEILPAICPWFLLEGKKKHSNFFLIITPMCAHPIKIWKLWESTKKETKITRNFTPQICHCEHLGVS